MRSFFSILFITAILLTAVQAAIPERFQRLVDAGEFSEARRLIRYDMAANPELSDAERLTLQFEMERLNRIEKDFVRTETEILAEIQKYIPTATTTDMRDWELEKSLEMKLIDGHRRYFRWAANNLFRINKDAKKIKAGKVPAEKKTGAFVLEKHLEQIVKTAAAEKYPFVVPQRFRVTYTLSVNANAVPAGENIRAWLPFPREVNGRQTDIELISTRPNRHLLAGNDHLQRSLYVEATAVADKKTIFQVIFEYTGHARFQPINPKIVRPLTPEETEELVPFLSERAPHILFSTEMQELAAKLVGNETNSARKAQKIYQWIDSNISWASAREYSTIPNISHYCLVNKHGDCGIQTLLFMTLARIAGIPTRWQSGFVTDPQKAGMHDWGRMYLPPYGWVPVDQSFGLRKSKHSQVKWFYFGSIDTYRLVVNDDYSQPLYPAKIYPRSETVDFQRGEVEWQGGNLFFDQWDWDLDVEYVK
ncbi:transglutaminase domain-containing protein [bacterium]|nr:transglutaminase domain-containing protein [bacterium]